MISVDINCDVGEGMHNEEWIMPYISSCNIACGAHAGDVKTIDSVIKIAHAHHVKIGAHPSFPDREHFGRKAMSLSPALLERSLIEQIESVQERLRLFNGENLHHVKAHGALYNVAAVDEAVAAVIVNAVKKTAPHAILYAPYNSKLARCAAQNQILVKHEAFADRNYQDDLRLVPRTEHKALIRDKEAIAEHLLQMIRKQKVKTISGSLVPIKADTYCIHGDHAGAAETAKHIYQSLTQNGILIA